jgi:signal transduction histidine kinase
LRSAYIHLVSLLDRLVDRTRSQDPRLLDFGLALGLTIWALASAGVVGDPWRALVLLTMTVAVAWCGRAPVTVLAIEVAGVVVLTNRLNLPSGIAFLIAAYTAALYSDRRVVVAALLLATAAWLFAFGGQVNIPSGLVPLLLLAPVWLAGSAMRRRAKRAEASAERADRLEREREAALRAERTRIARELHDLVTHAVSVMVLQTGAARQIMSHDQARSRAMLESVEASGRSALEELRRLLGVLSDDGDDAPLSPQPSVGELPSLVDQVRRAGQAVELSIEGQPRGVSAGVAVAAYRIVQEALTNVLKHAGGAPARVVLRWEDAALELEILDSGPGGATGRDAPAGRGITGMRERASMYGGTLEAHPDADRGYVVQARIPLEPGGG